MYLPLHRNLAKLLLRLNTSPRALVMCRGYNEEYDQFTELVWKDDKDLDFADRETYPQFQLWLYWPTVITGKGKAS